MKTNNQDNTNRLRSEIAVDSEKRLQSLTREMVRLEIMKFYISCRKPLPEIEILDAEVGVAMVDWAQIPADCLLAVCETARVACGGFLPSNGQVLDTYLTVFRNTRKAGPENPNDDYILDSFQVNPE